MSMTGRVRSAQGVLFLQCFRVEVIGLAERAASPSSPRNLRESTGEKDALCAPYAAVIDIDASKLPAAIR